MSEILDEATYRVTMLDKLLETLQQLMEAVYKMQESEQQKAVAAKEDLMKQSKQYCRL